MFSKQQGFAVEIFFIYYIIGDTYEPDSEPDLHDKLSSFYICKYFDFSDLPNVCM